MSWSATSTLGRRLLSSSYEKENPYRNDVFYARNNTHTSPTSSPFIANFYYLVPVYTFVIRELIELYAEKYSQLYRNPNKIT